MEIRLREIAYHTWCLVALGQRDVDCGCSASKLRFGNLEVCFARGGSAEEIELKGQNEWLMVRMKSGIEMQSGYGENTRSHVTAVGNY